MSEQRIEQALARAVRNLKNWFSATTSDVKEKAYAVNHAEWTAEKMEKNKFIREKRADQTRRRRKRVYWTDLGMNIGSELCEPHFCVVIKEFDKTAVIIPLSSVKENDPEKDWKTEDNGFFEIGVIEDLPGDKKPVYAVVSQIRTVSKKRLSDYKAPGTNTYVQLKLNDPQMDTIDSAIKNLFAK